MHKKINSKMRWVLFGLLCIVIGSGIGFFYKQDQTRNGNGEADTQAFASGGNTNIEESINSDANGELEEHCIVLGDEVYRYTDEIKTILFIGTDQSGNQSADGEYHGAMADMVMLLVMNHSKKEYAVLQLNRDTITNIHLIDENGEGMACADIQLCTAHWYGGNDKLNCENTVRAVSELFGGLEIDNYYRLSWEGIESLNHIVGGVTLTIWNDFSQIDASLVEGETITLTDEQAYIFLRGRHGIDDGENLSRMERHRQYLTAWVQKVKEESAKDHSFPAKIYQDLSPYAYTNVKGKDLTKQYQQIASYTNLGILTMEGTTEIGSSLGDGIEHMEFYMDEASKQETMEGLFHLELTDYDVDDYIDWE